MQVVHTFNRDIAKQGTVEDIPDDTAKALIRTGRARPATDEEVATGAAAELAAAPAPATPDALAAPVGAAPPPPKTEPQAAPATTADTEAPAAAKAKPEKPSGASSAPTTNK